MVKVAVIGCNSFSGSHFVDLILKNTDFDIIGVDRLTDKPDFFLPYKKDLKRFKIFKMDLNFNVDDMIYLFKEEAVEYIVNFAALVEVGPSWENPEDWFQTNCLSIVNLVNRLKKLSTLKKYIHISTCDIYGSNENIDENTPINPNTPYAVSKASADMFIQILIKNFNFPAIIIRPANIYGPGQNLFKIIPRSIIYLKTNKKIQLHGGGKAIKPYLYVKDVCSGILKAMQSEEYNGIYNLSSESEYSVREIVEKICNKLGKNFEESIEIVGERAGQDAKHVINSDKARKQFNWDPKINLDRGIDDCINWINKNWKIIKTLSSIYTHKK